MMINGFYVRQAVFMATGVTLGVGSCCLSCFPGDIDIPRNHFGKVTAVAAIALGWISIGLGLVGTMTTNNPPINPAVGSGFAIACLTTGVAAAVFAILKANCGMDPQPQHPANIEVVNQDIGQA